MEKTISIPKPKIDRELKEKFQNELALEGQVTVNISFTANDDTSFLRVWKTTFLFAINSLHKSKLLHFYNIPLYPSKIFVKCEQTIEFMLVFSALPKDCRQFDLIEQIPESGGFVFKNINRNQSDVYHLILQ